MSSYIRFQAYTCIFPQLGRESCLLGLSTHLHSVELLTPLGTRHFRRGTNMAEICWKRRWKKRCKFDWLWIFAWDLSLIWGTMLPHICFLNHPGSRLNWRGTERVNVPEAVEGLRWKALCKYKVSPWSWRILFQPPHCVVDSAYCEFDIFNYFACPK